MDFLFCMNCSRDKRAAGNCKKNGILNIKQFYTVPPSLVGVGPQTLVYLAGSCENVCNQNKPRARNLGKFVFCYFSPFFYSKALFLLEKVSLGNLAEKKKPKQIFGQGFQLYIKRKGLKVIEKRSLNPLNPFPASMESPRIKYLFNFLFIEYSQNMN